MKKNTPKETRKYTHLNRFEREEIAIGLEKGLKQSEIADLLQRSPSTISRELKRNHAAMKTIHYRASRAQLKYVERNKLSHSRKRIPNKRLRRFICKLIKKGYSPEIIAYLAKDKHIQWNISYETIYQWIYADRNDLILFLTRGHKKRRKRGCKNQNKGAKIPNRVMIENRPDYIALRSRIGDWETDTIISRQCKEAVMILLERRTRFIILKKLKGKNAYSMHKALVSSLESIPNYLRHSITYDNGLENVLHEKTNDVLGTQSYFCTPYHSWEKGSVENKIGILRRYYPKKTNWKNITQWDLNKVARFINNRPMKCLDYKTPHQVFVALAS